MEGFTLTPVDLKQFTDMFTESQRILREQAVKIANAKIVWVDVKEAAEISRYNEKTLKLSKNEIGFRTRGRDIFFKLTDLEKWLEKNYRAPRSERK